jgi:hypothetical protein
MLVNINEVANRLKISNRAVQIKCKKHGVLKIGNQYQITKDIAEKWYNKETEQKRTEQKTNTPISYTNRKKSVSVDSSVIIIILLAVTIISVAAFIFYLWHQNDTKDKTIIDKDKIIIVKEAEIKTIGNQLDDSVKVINKLRQQNRDLKYKDSMRIFKP